jgi:ATP-dependent Clp protease adaptor protein ClpS
MDFVVGLLQIFFGLSYAGAVKVMLDIHHHGKGICGTYTRDIAETKVAQVNEFARLHEHPLLSRMEKL